MDQLIAQLGLALAIGLLVGLERGWRERDAPDRSRTAGLRTFGLVGLLGGIFAALSEALGSGVLIAGFLGFAAIFAWFSAREAEHDQNFSVTGGVAAALASRFGEGGLLMTSAVSGAFDVDVAVLSALRLVEQTAAINTVGGAVLVALAANAIGRLFLSILAGPVRFSLPLAIITLAAAAAAGVAFWLGMAV